MDKAKGFTYLGIEDMIEDEDGNECDWRCNYCDSAGFSYHGVWIEDSGEFGDDRWQVECTGCGATAELK